MTVAGAIASRIHQLHSRHQLIVVTFTRSAAANIKAKIRQCLPKIYFYHKLDLLSRLYTIITMHKAKGLDWDYLFIPFLHATMIPGNLRVPTPTKFLGYFTLAEVAIAQIRASLHGQYPLPEVAQAWEQAGYLKTAE